MFETFWSTYPRRLARLDAEKAWKKIPAAQHNEVITALKNHVKAWQQKGTEKEFIPYPASWLNGQRWKDEIEIAPEMPQCDWNKNGNRGPEPRCVSQAVKEKESNFYCAKHATSLGLKLVRG